MSVTYFYSPFRACVVLSLISLAGVILGCSSGTDSVVDGISINEDACASGDGLDSLVGMEFQNGTLVIAYRCVDSSLELWRADTSLSSYEGLWISAMSGDYVLSRTENGVFGVATGVDVLTSNHELNLPFNARLVTADIMNDTVLVADSSGKLYRLSLGGRIIDSLSTGGHVTQVGVSVDRSSPLVLVDGGVSMVDFTSRTVTPLSQSIGEVDDQAFVLHGDTLTVLGNSLYQLIGDDVSKDSLDIQASNAVADSGVVRFEICGDRFYAYSSTDIFYTEGDQWSISLDDFGDCDLKKTTCISEKRLVLSCCSGTNCGLKQIQLD